MSLTINELVKPLQNPFMFHAPNVQVGNMASGLSPTLFGGSNKLPCQYPFVQIGRAVPTGEHSSVPASEARVGSSMNLPIKGLYQTANYQFPPALVENIPLYAAGGSFCPAFGAPLIPINRFAIQPPNQDFFYI